MEQARVMFKSDTFWFHFKQSLNFPKHFGFNFEQSPNSPYTVSRGASLYPLFSYDIWSRRSYPSRTFGGLTDKPAYPRGWCSPTNRFNRKSCTAARIGEGRAEGRRRRRRRRRRWTDLPWLRARAGGCGGGGGGGFGLKITGALSTRKSGTAVEG